MDSNDFRDFAKVAIDLIADYTDNIRERDVFPNVERGYLHKLLPSEAPQEGEDWRRILDDFNKVILPGVTHWQSPYFHGYYPTSASYASIVGEILSAGLSVVGFNWVASPACTELEVVVMDWLGKMLGLPDVFLTCGEGHGSGVIQGSASESTYLSLLAAKDRTLQRILSRFPQGDVAFIKGKMIGYTSDQANSSVEKAGTLGSMLMRLLPCDKHGSLLGSDLVSAMREDIANGFIPTFVCATLGTTTTCAFDNLEEIGPICREFGVWLHVDAAYAGSACVCPEFRSMLKGVAFVDSFCINPHKWLLVNYDCSALWMQDSRWFVDAFSVDREYLQHRIQTNPWTPDYRHWQIPLGRRFRSLKLWITLRSYGVTGLQTHIRKQVSLAQLFEELIRADSRFTVISSQMGLVCFKLKGSCLLNEHLLNELTARRKIYLISGKFRGELILRFAVCSRLTEARDIHFSWHEIQSVATDILCKIGLIDEISERNTLSGFSSKISLGNEVLNS